MASKSETRAAIVSLAKELNVTTPDVEQIDKLEPLEALLKELQDKKAALSPGDGAPPPPAPSAAPGAGVGAPPPPPSELSPKPPAELVATTYMVNEGKSVTTKRGTIGALETVWSTDFDGGQTDLDHWVSNGYVTKTDHFKQ